MVDFKREEAAPPVRPVRTKLAMEFFHREYVHFKGLVDQGEEMCLDTLASFCVTGLSQFLVGLGLTESHFCKEHGTTTCPTCEAGPEPCGGCEEVGGGN